MTLSKIFLIFIVYSFIGWLIEVTCKRIELGRFINRGVLIGPYCPIYGAAGVIITLAIDKYYSSVIVVFVMSMFICAVLEYVTSYILEKMFNARWWDYSRYKYNINGRICLETMIPFGVLGCLVVYLVNPFFQNVFLALDNNLSNILAGFLFVIFLFDIFLSLKVMSNFKIATLKFKNKDNTEEITKKVKDVLTNKSLFTKRLVNAFPNFKAAIVNIKNELVKTKKELRLTKKELKKSNTKIDKMEKKLRKNKSH